LELFPLCFIRGLTSTTARIANNHSLRRDPLQDALVSVLTRDVELERSEPRQRNARSAVAPMHGKSGSPRVFGSGRCAIVRPVLTLAIVARPLVRECTMHGTFILAPAGLSVKLGEGMRNTGRAMGVAR
jgi:hypothetical protein